MVALSLADTWRATDPEDRETLILSMDVRGFLTFVATLTHRFDVVNSYSSRFLYKLTCTEEIFSCRGICAAQDENKDELIHSRSG